MGILGNLFGGNSEDGYSDFGSRLALAGQVLMAMDQGQTANIGPSVAALNERRRKIADEMQSKKWLQNQAAMMADKNPQLAQFLKDAPPGVGESLVSAYIKTLPEFQLPDPMADLERQIKEAQLQKYQAEVDNLRNPDARKSFGLQPQYGVDADGKPVLLQLGSDGSAVATRLPDGVTLSPKADRVDAGTSWIILDPITRQPVGTIPKDVSGEAAARAAGTVQGQAQSEAPAAAITAEQTISKIDQLLADPDLGSVSGVESWLPDPMLGAYTNGRGLDLRRRVEQLQGSAFLEAFNGLKGGGAITEVEGKKAEDALARLNTAQTDAAFRQALVDFRNAVATGYAKLSARAGGNAPAMTVPPPPAAPPPSASETPAAPASEPLSAPQPGDTMDGFRFKGGDPSKPENWEQM